MPDPQAILQAAPVVASAAFSFWWVQPLVTTLGVGAAAVFARAAINANRQIARIRATLDLIERTESQQYYQDLWAAFREAREDPDGFSPLLNPRNETIKQQRAKVLSFLNHYELVAVGCKNGVLDKNFYKNYMRSAFVRDWLKSQDFIKQLREAPAQPRNRLAYEHFEALAREWNAEIVVEIANS